VRVVRVYAEDEGYRGTLIEIWRIGYMWIRMVTYIKEY